MEHISTDRTSIAIRSDNSFNNFLLYFKTTGFRKVFANQAKEMSINKYTRQV